MSARAVVVGNGVNELVAAHLLSRSYEVIVCPEGDSGEGAMGWVPPRIVKALDLQGLKVEAPDPWAVASSSTTSLQTMCWP